MSADRIPAARNAGIATFMGLPSSRDLDGVASAVVGIPYDLGGEAGGRHAPRQIRHVSWTLRPAHGVFDIDAVDPAFAPGTGRREPGGLTSREALALVRGLRGLEIVGYDLNEVNPLFETEGTTCVLAANLAFEFLALTALRVSGH